MTNEEWWNEDHDRWMQRLLSVRYEMATRCTLFEYKRDEEAPEKYSVFAAAVSLLSSAAHAGAGQKEWKEWKESYCEAFLELMCAGLGASYRWGGTVSTGMPRSEALELLARAAHWGGTVSAELDSEVQRVKRGSRE